MCQTHNFVKNFKKKLDKYDYSCYTAFVGFVDVFLT